MAHSDYTYQVTSHGGHAVIAIEDTNGGGMSVTNNIENVVEEIGIKEKIDPEAFVIVYKDSDDRWDGWDDNRQAFIYLNAVSWWTAVEAYLTKYL